MRIGPPDRRERVLDSAGGVEGENNWVAPGLEAGSGICGCGGGRTTIDAAIAAPSMAIAGTGSTLGGVELLGAADACSSIDCFANFSCDPPGAYLSSQLQRSASVKVQLSGPFLRKKPELCLAWGCCPRASSIRSWTRHGEVFPIVCIVGRAKFEKSESKFPIFGL